SLLGVEYYLDLEALKNAGLDPSATLVSFTLKHVRAKMFLDLALGQNNLGYKIRDGILIVSSKDKLATDLMIRVYDCRDLLAAYTGPRARSATPAERSKAAGGAFSVPESASPEKKEADSGEKKSDDSASPKNPLEDDMPMLGLIDAITSTVEPESW